jgi:hypothetical protein
MLWFFHTCTPGGTNPVPVATPMTAAEQASAVSLIAPWSMEQYKRVLKLFVLSLFGFVGEQIFFSE